MADNDEPPWIAAGYEPRPRPEVPSDLPSVAPVENLQALLDRLDGMATDEERVQCIRDELRSLRVLVRFFIGMRSHYCSRMWLADIPTHVIAKAAGVADSYVSKRARQVGFPPRRTDRRRGGTPRR